MDLQSVTVDAMRALGEFLETRIGAIGMSPASLSAKTGISRPAIYRLMQAATPEEAGRAHKRTLEQVAIALKFREWAALLNAWREDDVLAGLEDEQKPPPGRSERISLWRARRAIRAMVGASQSYGHSAAADSASARHIPARAK
jgi:hypothetical protein